MSLSYARLRQLHFRKSMAEHFRDMGRTAIIVVVFFGWSGILAIAGIERDYTRRRADCANLSAHGSD